MFIMNYKLFLLIFNACVLFHSSSLVHASITTCSQTPYPEVCDYFVANSYVFETNQVEKRVNSLRDQSLLVTIDHALQAHQLISKMDLTSFGPRAKLAWFDCMELYEDTIYHLNRSTLSTNPLDSQTWLSAAIANQQTCRNGFLDQKLDSHLEYFPDMLTNFSKLLSNSLAINKANINPQSRGGGRKLLSDGYPSWVSTADRKLLQATRPVVKADVVVAQDGSGQYKTINAALGAAKGKGGSGRFVIYIKKGVYRENVEIKRSMKNIMLIGDGIDATIVTGSKSAQETTTFRSATVGVSGDHFIARDMTFENTAGPAKHQAVALRSGSDFSVFYSCSFKGNQDTLYVYSQRQFYKNCDIYGTVDFIFGDAVAVLQSCNIYVRKGTWKNTVTAQGRTDPNENTGIVIHSSRVIGAGASGSDTYLGRPWQKYSRTVFMKCGLDGIVNSAGWLPWSGNFALSTLYYGEFANTGAGAATSGRVKWGGYHVMSAVEAGKFTVGNFLAGNSWIPSTGVPFDAGL